MRAYIFDRLSLVLLLALVVLLPVFFLPFTTIPTETAKGMLLVGCLAFSLIAWVVARFYDGRILFPRSKLLFSGFVVVGVFLVSALLSSGKHVSMFGTMFEVGTFWFMFAGFSLMLLAAILFKDSRNARILLFGVLVSTALVLIFQTLRFFFPAALSFGLWNDKTGNLIGSLNAFGIFAGFSALTHLLFLEFLPISRIMKFFSRVFLLLALFLVAAVNFSLVWMLIGISALVIFVYRLSLNLNREEGEEGRFPLLSFALMIVSLLFLISGSSFGNFLPKFLGIKNTEISPSFTTTLAVTKEVIKKDPVLGLGPNRFGEAWALYKPEEVNQTRFAEVLFNSGSGLIPTFFATTGVLGFVSLLVFFGLFLYSGIKSVLFSLRNKTGFETMAFFVLALYFFVASFFYSTGALIFLLALAFSGVFVGLNARSEGREIEVSFLSDHRKSFFSILFLVLIITFTVISSFKYTERFVSVFYFGRALAAPDVPEAEKAISKALSLYSNDLYLRTYAQVQLLKFNTFIAKGDSITEEDKALMQLSFDAAVGGAQLATNYNPNNYLNFQSLGSLYQSFGLYGVKDAYTRATEAYKFASDLNPLSPGSKLLLSGVLVADKKLEEAKAYATEALSLKQDYVQALVTLSQIASLEGDKAVALDYAKRAQALAPLDKDLTAYVDSLRGGTVAPAPSLEGGEEE